MPLDTLENVNILDDLDFDFKDLNPYQVMNLTRSEKIDLILCLEEKDLRDLCRRFYRMFPDVGMVWREEPIPARAGYVKHLAFFESGLHFRERCLLAANRIGKSEAGAYEVTCHLTGEYPEWWTGKRLTKIKIRAWAAGKTNETTRDIIQAKLLGPVTWINGKKTVAGTGMIPKELIGAITWKQGVADMVDTVKIKNTRSQAWSILGFKAYAQGRGSFEGTEQDIIWLDEEPPQDVYGECLIRTATTKGLIFITFTPLEGMSDVVLSFLPAEYRPDDDLLLPEDRIRKPFMVGVTEISESKCMVQASWDDAPHLDETTKRELLASTPPYLRDARSKGEPSLGAGAIYPIPESEITVNPFMIPAFWPKAYALDVGWNRTAAVWGALDNTCDTIYVFTEHYRGAAEPSVHADAIKARGKWMNGAIDPASNGRSQIDGQQLMQMYRDLGLNVFNAENSIEAGIYEVWQRLSTNRLKIFSTCHSLFYEYRLYRRDPNGKIIKTNDHIMDALRYLVMSIRDISQVEPVGKLIGDGSVNGISDSQAGY